MIQERVDFTDCMNSIYLALWELCDEVLGRPDHFLDIAPPRTPEECWANIEKKFSETKKTAQKSKDPEYSRQLAIAERCILRVSETLTRWRLIKNDREDVTRDRILVEVTELKTEMGNRALSSIKTQS